MSTKFNIAVADALHGKIIFTHDDIYAVVNQELDRPESLAREKPPKQIHLRVCGTMGLDTGLYYISMERSDNEAEADWNYTIRTFIVACDYQGNDEDPSSCEIGMPYGGIWVQEFDGTLRPFTDHVSNLLTTIWDASLSNFNALSTVDKMLLVRPRITKMTNSEKNGYLVALLPLMLSLAEWTLNKQKTEFNTTVEYLSWKLTAAITVDPVSPVVTATMQHKGKNIPLHPNSFYTTHQYLTNTFYNTKVYASRLEIVPVLYKAIEEYAAKLQIPYITTLDDIGILNRTTHYGFWNIFNMLDAAKQICNLAENTTITHDYTTYRVKEIVERLAINIPNTVPEDKAEVYNREFCTIIANLINLNRK